MIHSMTAFGSARADVDQGTLTLEIRSVNSRFLDIHFKLPEDLPQVETPLRELVTQTLSRGKVEIRANYARQDRSASMRIDPLWLTQLAEQYATARAVLPDLAPPRMVELMNWPGQRQAEAFDAEVWGKACVAAAREALPQLQASRLREGARLAEVMLTCAVSADLIVQQVEAHLPTMLHEHRAKLAAKLQDTVSTAFPNGFVHISGAELSERLSHEAALFALRIDVAEELARLRSHFAELRHILGEDQDTPPATGPGAKPGAKPGTKRTGSAGKRLDFLFQEMNREANTLGSKAASLDVTRAAIDLKLLIEQMREQAQNIE